mmetsp:Transcript_52613/g.120871  ORF Transcript_52613/g.120871 Transcript_52613/m.120871 type:complete len:86 (+) Transcript_52613:2-259(+)
MTQALDDARQRAAREHAIARAAWVRENTIGLEGFEYDDLLNRHHQPSGDADLARRELAFGRMSEPTVDRPLPECVRYSALAVATA